MLQIQNKQLVRFYKIDRGTVYFVVAVVFKVSGSDMVAISSPKIVKIIHKSISELPGKVAELLKLEVCRVAFSNICEKILFYTSVILGISPKDTIVWFKAQPPTV